MARRTLPNENNRIRQLREAVGYTRAELAMRAGIGASTIARYESSTFSSRVPAGTQQKIAEALGKSIHEVFVRQEPAMNRRQFLAGVGAGLGIVGVGAELATHGFSASLNDAFGLNRSRQVLSSQEVQTLIDDNYATWELFNTLQIGASIDYTTAIAHGKVITLKHLAECSLPQGQKHIILTLLGDMYLLISRVARELRNFGECERYLNEAMAVGRDIESVDLKSATREYYGSMLVDQEMFVTAERNGEAILTEAKGASFPIWAEAQLTAAYAQSYAGKHATAQRLADEAHKIPAGPDPQIWVGHLTNPDVVYSQFGIIARTTAQKNYEAVQASEESLKNLQREQPDNLQFRARLRVYRATALWQMGSLEAAVTATEEGLSDTQRIGSILNYQRIEKLYQKMRTSPHKTHPMIRNLGELLFAG